MCGTVDVPPNITAGGQRVNILVVIKAVKSVLELNERIKMFAMNPQMFCIKLQEFNCNLSLWKVMTKVIRSVHIPDINFAIKSIANCFLDRFGFVL